MWNRFMQINDYVNRVLRKSLHATKERTFQIKIINLDWTLLCARANKNSSAAQKND